MCFLCPSPTAAPSSPWQARRAFVLAAAAGAAAPAWAQVDVGSASGMRRLVPAETLESSATQQYNPLLAQARAQRALAPPGHPQLERLHAIARRLIPFTAPWNDRARHWRWEVNLIASKQINAFCMPGGKIAFFTGILDQLRLTDDETAMVMGHEMAHALREHARERLAKTQATNLGLRLGAQLLGLGDMGQLAANLGGQLLTLKFSRSDESEADLVGLELAARAAYQPAASVSLWQKMGQATGGKGGLAFLSTHPSGPDRIRELQDNLPKVQKLYEAAVRG
ncbi:MAG: M48 family metallopeptidase [Burkholderiales bacterium]|nr:M48 family metallopeptidase [Burkholderiales bacterium]